MAQTRRTTRSGDRPSGARFGAGPAPARRDRRRQPRTAGPYLIAAFALFIGFVGGLMWFFALPGGFGRNALEPEYPVHAPPSSTAPIITVQTLP